MSHTIELRNVSKYYAGNDSISMGFSRVDLELDIGEFVVVTGESGSGKSTLLNVISGLDTYEEGEMFVCGEDTTAYGTEDYEEYRKTYIGNIFQEFNLINSYTVYENIELVMLLSGKDRNECKERVDKLIEIVGLNEYRNAKASKLSGGQKQRVAIARALAKDAPIIVADEPTGNLDSVSAEAVMGTLAKVSKDKLVIVVTHNYEQAEPYATRKLTMHDGRLVEDKTINTAGKSRSNAEDGIAAEQFEAASPGKMKRSSELRLGVRNAFNLPMKFMLLFVVYLFVSTAVLGQYATEKNSMHETDLLGVNQYFVNTNANRVIVKKLDGSSFTDSDVASVMDTPNIKGVVKNDVALDSGVSISLGDMNIEGPVVSLDHVSADEITYGRMPQNDNEIVIRLDSASDAYITVYNNGDDYIGESVLLKDMNQTLAYDITGDIKIAGFILDEDDSGYSLYGYSTIYASEAVSKELLSSIMATVSETDISFENAIVKNDFERAVYPSPNVPDGKAYIFDDEQYYYDDEKAAGKDVELKIKNKFFESEGKYTVDKIITQSNCSKLVGIPKDNYDLFYYCVFISSNDFKELFDKGYYQISAFMINEQESEETKDALLEKGFTTMIIKDSLSDSSGDVGEMLDLMAYGKLLLEFVILFLIAYAVIRLIMRSRNSYFATLRMLGATKGNITNILRTELVLMMLIAYGVVVLGAVLISQGVLQSITGSGMKEITKLLYYLDPLDYGILGVLLLFMSWLIGGRHSRHIFEKSAMKTFREGV